MNTLFTSDEMKDIEQQQNNIQDSAHADMSKAQCKLPDEVLGLSELTELEQKVLALRAYLGRYKDSGKFKILAKHHNLLMQDINDIGYNLCNKGYLYYEWGGRGTFNTYELKQRYLFPIILFVFDRHPEWLTEFRAITKQDEETADIWHVMQMVYDEDIQGLRQHKEWKMVFYFHRDNWTDIKYYESLIVHRFFAPYSIVLPIEIIQAALDRCMQVDYLNDKMSDEHLQAYERCAELKFANKQIPKGHIDGKDKELILNMLCQYRFFLSGELRPESLTMYTAGVVAAKAIRSLYEGNPQEANKLFEVALKAHNDVSNDKNLFYNPILSFYLMLCYSKLDKSDALEKAVATFAKKKYVSSNPDLQGAAFVAHHLILQDRAAMRKDDLKDLKSI